MATKPSRLQQQACDQLAEALVLITAAARLDGGGSLDRGATSEVAKGLARASSAFKLDEILSRALERRGLALGLPSGASELLTLMETEVAPLDALLLSDDDFRALIDRLREELGEV